MVMKRFLRKKVRSFFSSSSFSWGFSKSSDSLQPTLRLDSSSPGFYFASTRSSASRRALLSQGSWNVCQAQNLVPSMGEIVVLEETCRGKVKSQFVTKLPSCNPDHELEEAFLRFDANRDGKISACELGSVLRSLGDNPTDEELLLMVKEVDRDGDGFIDLQEFVLLNSACSSSGKEDLRQAFLIFDADADGKISVEELHNVLGRLGESCTLEECRRMIRRVDTDGDGFVDFQEFCTMMTT